MSCLLHELNSETIGCKHTNIVNSHRIVDIIHYAALYIVDIQCILLFVHSVVSTYSFTDADDSKTDL